MEIHGQNGTPYPIAQIDANEAAFARRYGWQEAPYAPPSDGFYFGNYPLDSCITADLLTTYGYYRRSAKQLNSLRRTQRENGMVPGISFPPQRFTPNPERWMASRPFESLDYTQSPVWAYSVHELYTAAHDKTPVVSGQGLDPEIFLRDIYPSLRRYYQYFIDHLQVSSDDPRVFLLHPCQSNRDSGVEFDQWKQDELQRQLGGIAALLKRKPRKGEYMSNGFNHKNRVKEYVGTLAINLAGHKKGWDPAKIHETTEFIDVWFNCLLAESYGSMSELAAALGKDEDQEIFAKLATKLQAALLDKHYIPDARDSQGAFYSIYNDAPVRKHTIGNLVAPLLPGIRPEQLQAQLDLMDEHFDTPFPLPSVGMDDVANWDPHYQEIDRHWRTPAWVVANVIVMRALDRQLDRPDLEEDHERLRNRCWEWFYKLQQKNLAVVQLNNGASEHHNPLTGEGQRMHRTKGHVFGLAGYIHA